MQSSDDLMQQALRATAAGASRGTSVDGAGANGTGQPPPRVTATAVQGEQPPPAQPQSAQTPPQQPPPAAAADQPIQGDTTALEAQIAQLNAQLQATRAEVRRAQRLAAMCAGGSLLMALIVLYGWAGPRVAKASAAAAAEYSEGAGDE